MYEPEPQKEHAWLTALVGEWRVDTVMSMGPDAPPATMQGTETVRALGALWIQCDGVPADETHGRNVFTFGFDPKKKKFVGTFISSLMAELWLYEGELDEKGTTLELHSDGPSMSGDGTTRHYIDSIEVVNADERILRSRMQLPDGSYSEFMKATYQRVK